MSLKLVVFLSFISLSAFAAPMDLAERNAKSLAILRSYFEGEKLPPFLVSGTSYSLQPEDYESFLRLRFRSVQHCGFSILPMKDEDLGVRVCGREHLIADRAFVDLLRKKDPVFLALFERYSGGYVNGRRHRLRRDRYSVRDRANYMDKVLEHSIALISPKFVDLENQDCELGLRD